MAAALAAGADGVRVGTRFVAAEAQDTAYTDVFSVGWPNAPHRCLRSSVEAAQAFLGEVVGEELDRFTGKRFPIRHFQPVTITETASGVIDAMSQWAGESVGGVKRLQPAAEIVRELAGDAEPLLRRWS